MSRSTRDPLEKVYPLAAETFGAEELDAVRAVLDTGRLTMGEQVAAFERAFAEWVGVEHAVMVNSGSSANLVMVDAMLRRSDREGPWHPGDEVLVPALCWPTTAWAVIQLGLVPVFVDVDRQTLAIDLESAAAAIGPRTRGLYLVHVVGQIPHMDRYTSFCERHGLVLLEDACEGLGAHFAGRHAGTFGAAGSFSCYFSHHLSTIEGGVMVTGDAALAEDLRSARAYGWLRQRGDADRWLAAHPDLDGRFFFVTSGFNVRPTEIQGAIGRVQLARLDRMMADRERLAALVQGWVARDAPWLRLVGADHVDGRGPDRPRRERAHSWMTLAFHVAPDAPLDRAAVTARLESFGVETRPILAGNLLRHPAMARVASRSVELPVCDEMLARGFMIGCHPVRTARALDSLAQAFHSLAGA
ncbi:MAG: DegT/DnrJ/EryC1/StrS family aminotransferase [bacterium]